MTPARHLPAIEAAFLMVRSSGFIGAKFGLPYAGALLPFCSGITCCCRWCCWR